MDNNHRDMPVVNHHVTFHWSTTYSTTIHKIFYCEEKPHLRCPTTTHCGKDNFATKQKISARSRADNLIIKWIPFNVSLQESGSKTI
jgi:hypothetical protein